MRFGEWNQTIQALTPVLLSVMVGVCAAGSAVPSHADQIPSRSFVVAEQSIGEDMRQNAQESPDFLPPDPAAAEAALDPSLAARRAKMIEECEDNNGVDCATEVDTELGAEQLQAGGVRHFAPSNRP
jgi:hypothetical protein